MRLIPERISALSTTPSDYLQINNIRIFAILNLNLSFFIWHSIQIIRRIFSFSFCLIFLIHISFWIFFFKKKKEQRHWISMSHTPTCNITYRFVSPTIFSLFLFSSFFSSLLGQSLMCLMLFDHQKAVQKLKAGFWGTKRKKGSR